MTLLEAERRKCEFLETLGGRAPEPDASSGAVPRSRRPSTFGVARREGARAPADRGRVVPAARARGRRSWCSGWASRPSRTGSRRSPGCIGGALERRPPGLLAIRKTGPTPAGLPAPRRACEEAPARPELGRAGSCPPPRLAWVGARPRLRSREPEGRRRQDDDRRQPRRLPRRGRRALPARRSRPAGERDLGARRGAQTASRRTTCSTASRSPSSRSRPRSRTSTSCPPSPSSRPRRCSSRAIDGGERYLADALVAPATDPLRVRLPRLPAGVRRR